MARMSLADLLNGVTRFGRLTVASEAEPRPSKVGGVIRYVNCRCDCGAERIVRASTLKAGVTLSCGCLHKERAATLAERTCLKHGDSRQRAKAPEYGIYRTMLSRCFNPNVERYPLYGGRGITVCERWRGEGGYENFIADLGYRPSATASLERQDNDGDYEPGNVRWATRKDQARNKASTRWVTYQGQQMSLAELAETLGLSQSTLRNRVEKRWPEQRLAEPLRGRKSKAS